MIETSHLNSDFWNHLRHSKHSISGFVQERRRRHFVRVIERQTRMRVAGGPFAGMIVGREHVYGSPFAKLLGTYEKELHPHIDEIIASAPQTILDIGGADGYYAIGMALKEQVGNVVVWETLAAGREMIEQRASVNGISEEIEVQGECDEVSLHETIVNRPAGALFMDVEGAECELLSSRVCSALRSWIFIIETHDFLRPGCADILIRMLCTSHRIFTIQSKLRAADDFPFQLTATSSLKCWAMEEGRPSAMSWIVGYPNTSMIHNC